MWRAGRLRLLVAEAGVNHNGESSSRGELVDAAAAAGADAVKFQTFRAEGVAAAAAPKAGYQLETTDGDESQLEMLRRLELDRDAFAELKVARGASAGSRSSRRRSTRRASTCSTTSASPRSRSPRRT